jgi:uncharacterized protein YacL
MKDWKKILFEKGLTPHLFSILLLACDAIFIVCIFGLLAFLLVNLNNSNGQSLFGYVLAIIVCIISIGFSVLVAITLEGQMNVFSNNLEKLNKKLQELEKENSQSLNIIHKKLDAIENLCKKKE